MRLTRIKRKISGSDCVTGLIYDPVSGKMVVEFDHGGIYEYSDVDAMTAAGFETADSKGEYFNDNIRGRYGFRRVG